MQFSFGWLVVLMSSVCFKTTVIILVHTLGMALAMTIASPCSFNFPSQSITHVKLQFDGCLRPPRDPGFPTITHRMAVCASCVGIVIGTGEDNKGDNETIFMPLAVGSVELPIPTKFTSQHAEYEGLLLGLEWLVKFFSSPEGIAQYALKENGVMTQNDSLRQQKILISIEGDCKTVMDQLSGKSIPRKLESLHQRAKSLLHQLTSDDGAKTDKAIHIEVEYSHISRIDNPISDSLCNNLMNVIAAKSWIDNIQQLEEAEVEIIGCKPSSSHTFSKSLKLSDFLQNAIITTRHSSRPFLYEMVANLAIKAENYKLLIEIGEQLVQEGSLKTKPTNPQRCDYSSESLKRSGIGYQIQGWRGRGKEKKAIFLERKHRILLSSNINDDRIVPLTHNENYDGKVTEMVDSAESMKERYETLKSVGDIAKGDWDTVIPDTWRPILDKWFVFARYEAEEGLPTWAENKDRH